MSTLAIPAMSQAANAMLAGGPAKPTPVAAKTRAVAENFEAVYLSSMFQQMFANVAQGAFSGGPGAQIWRSFLSDEYAKSFAKSGGIGIADQVQRQLMALQEAK